MTIPRPLALSRAALRWSIAIIGGLLIVAAGVAWHRARLESELLQLAPDAPIRASLLRYAADRAVPVYADHCAQCHGHDMRGDRMTGVPDLTDREWIYGSGRTNEIEQTILYGIRSGHHRAHDLADMPAFGHARPYRRYALPTFGPRQIADLTEYVMALQRAPVDGAAAARGKTLFNGSGQCYDCHTSDASGDSFAGAPSLVDKVWLYGDGSRGAVAEALTDGHAGVCPAWIGRLRAGDIKALAVYLNATSNPHHA